MTGVKDYLENQLEFLNKKLSGLDEANVSIHLEIRIINRKLNTLAILIASTPGKLIKYNNQNDLLYMLTKTQWEDSQRYTPSPETFLFLIQLQIFALSES